jgi:ATP-dependent DNA helicase RecG
VPAFDEIVVRELLVNALVHRPYTQRGDIFLNLPRTGWR